jgi:phage tail protein X
MFVRGSRYQDALPFTRAGEQAFGGVRPRAIGVASGVIEHVVRAGDRLDLLARHYYNDDRLGWRILDANPDILHGAVLLTEAMQGEVILIPRARE